MRTGIVHIGAEELTYEIRNIIGVADKLQELGVPVYPDKRFVYYLLASTGICVVPLTSFSTNLQGFRLTLLEPDEKRFRGMVDTLGQGIEDYISSCPSIINLSTKQFPNRSF
jgi:alanine-synthesizing transaminase